MTRRSAFLALAAIVGRGLANEAKDANVTIDFNVLQTFKLKYNGMEQVVTGKEIFKAVTGRRCLDCDATSLKNRQ